MAGNRLIPVLAGLTIALQTACPVRAQLGVEISAPEPLNTNAASDSGTDGWPRPATDGAGHWIVVWHSTDDLGGSIGTDRDILIARSADNGWTWTAPAALNNQAATDDGLDTWESVDTDAAGHWMVVWQSENELGQGLGTDRDIVMASSTDNGATWSDPVAVNTNAASDSGQDQGPEVATDGAGVWIVVWYSQDDLSGTIGGDMDILFARSSDDGLTWSAPAALNTNAAVDSGDDNGPYLTTDGLGHWVVVWQSAEDLDGIGVDGDILVARSSDNGVTWSAPEALNANAATDSGTDSAARVVTDRTGHWVVVWTSLDDQAGTIGTDADILFATSADNGLTWSGPGVLNSTAATDNGDDTMPRLTTDEAGNWVVVWITTDDAGGTIGSDPDVLIARSSDNGMSWSAPSLLNTNAALDSGTDGSAEVATDAAGSWMVFWHSTENLGGTIGDDQDILRARFVLPDCNANGVPDRRDIAIGTSRDRDQDGVPDECESDLPAPCSPFGLTAILLLLGATLLTRSRGRR